MSTADYEKFFDAVDKDKNGTLSFQELEAFLKKKGYGDSEIKVIFATTDSSGDNKVSKEEFLQAMGAAPPTVHSTSSMRIIFKGFDANGDGFINRAELKKIWEEMGKVLSDEETTKVMGWLDTNKDDKINYEELCAYFQSGR